MKILSYLFARMREPSTWAGLTAIATGAANLMVGNYVEAATQIMGGLGAVLLKEGAKP